MHARTYTCMYIHTHIYTNQPNLYYCQSTHVVAVKGLGGVVEQGGVAQLREEEGELPHAALALQPPG